jgi:lysophospholipase L1-like esterase
MPINRLFDSKYISYTMLVLLLSACTADQPRIRQLSSSATIVAFGDSITYGSGAAPSDSYPSILRALTGLNVINSGIPGETSSKGLVRLADVLDSENPQLLILCHGGNDFLRKLDQQQLYHNMVAMIKQARERDIDVILLGVPQPKLMFMKSAPVYEKVAKELKVPINTEIIPKVVSDNSLKSDLLHPNKSGYRLIAESVYQLIKQSGGL